MPALRRILVLVNPTAGRGRISQSLPSVLSLIEERAIQVECIAPDNVVELARIARDQVSSHDAILVAGGDGTFQQVVRATLGSSVPLGIVPLGGGNDVAAALGIPRDPIAAAATFLAAAPRPVDILRARFSDGRDAIYVGGGGIGLDAAAARLASGRFSRLPGALRYFASALWALQGFVAPLTNVELDGKPILPSSEPLLLAAVTNTATYGAGLRIAPGAQIDDGLLDVTLVGKLGLLRVLEAFPILLRTGDLHWPEVTRVRGRNVVLRTQGPTPFHGDGEILGETPVEIEVLPGAISVIAPRLAK